MNIYELIENRRSVRSYRDEPVSEKSLNKILEAARLAPSAHNAQEYKFVVIKEPKTIKEIFRAASGQKFIAEAPIVIAAVALNPEALMSSGVPAYAVDLAIAVDHMTLAAVEEGLGTCWIGAFSQEDVKRILKIPEEFKVIVLLPLGVPRDIPGIKSRKKINELVSYESFSGPEDEANSETK